jgi:hypothetical protein
MMDEVKLQKIRDKTLEARKKADKINKAVNIKISEKQSKKTDPLKALVAVVSLMFLLLFIYVCYLFFWPQNPLVIRSVAVITPVVKSPGTLTYQIDVCKNTSLTPVVNRKIVQGNNGVSLQTSQGLATKGCRIAKVTIQVPPGITPGDHYVLYSDITYHVNALRDVHVYWHSQPFQIVN